MNIWRSTLGAIDRLPNNCSIQHEGAYSVSTGIFQVVILLSVSLRMSPPRLHLDMSKLPSRCFPERTPF